MKPDRINYQKTFNLGNYTSERIGLEAQLDEGEDAVIALTNLKVVVEKLHQVTNPQLDFSPPSLTDAATITRPITEQQVEKPTDRIKSIIEDIYSCKEIKVLESYKLMAKRNHELQEAYDAKLKSLQ